MTPLRFASLLCASVLGAAALSACIDIESNSESHSDLICKTLAQSQVSATANNGSSLSNSQQAFDGDLASFATLTPAAANGGGSFRNALASSQPAGTIAGTAFTTPTSGIYNFTVTTYLGGTQQESKTLGPASYGASSSQDCSGGSCRNSNGQSFFGVVTSKAFDAFQVSYAVSSTTTPVQVRELCVQ